MEITGDQYIRNFKIQTREELPLRVQVLAEYGFILQISRSAFYSFQYVFGRHEAATVAATATAGPAAGAGVSGIGLPRGRRE